MSKGENGRMSFQLSAHRFSVLATSDDVQQGSSEKLSVHDLTREQLPTQRMDTKLVSGASGGLK